MSLHNEVSNRTTQSALHSNHPPPSKPVNADTYSTYLGKVQPHCNYWTETIHSHIYSHHREMESSNKNAQASKRQQRGFEPSVTRLRVRHSTTELPCFSDGYYEIIVCRVSNYFLVCVWGGGVRLVLIILGPRIWCYVTVPIVCKTWLICHVSVP